MAQERPSRMLQIEGKEYALKEKVTPAQYDAWASANVMDPDVGIPALNEVLAEPVALDDFETIDEYFELHRAIWDFFVALRWGRSEPQRS
jgi:hypothetical protein